MSHIYNLIINGELASYEYFQANLDYCHYYASGIQESPESEYSSFWSHMELGAGNYGEEGHSKTSQRMTVLMDLKFVSNKPNYVDTLAENNEVNCNPSHQYAVLFETLDQLVEKQGNKGIFHVNDIYSQYSDYAADRLKEYARDKGYNEVIIESIAGDYTKIIPSKTLEKYTKFLYDSVHLKNPEVSFYNYGMDGNEMLSNEESRAKARLKLQFLADLSHKGLYFFPINHHDVFIPKEERLEFIDKGIFYNPTIEYGAVGYDFPEGHELPKDYGNVYYIHTSYKC
ncbi:MAG: hypothetical protein N4A31_02045 [Rickettsiales bacterium]|jgi:hypothetical protein|nr:hypothetical protein [Rickettsiales bacterium]